MTQEQATAEINYYHWICQKEHPDTCITIHSIDGYSDTQKKLAMAEIAYWYSKRRLPMWSVMIESVKTDKNGNSIFIHRSIAR